MRISRFLFFTAFCVMTFSLISCSSKPKNQTREQAVEEFRASLTTEDTTAMLSLCNSAMEQLKQGKIDDMLLGLSEYDDSTKQVLPISERMLNRFRHQLKRFPVKDYELQYYSMMLEGCNDVKYKVTFATGEQTGGAPATTMYMFNPVKVNGEWRLCVKTQNDEFDYEHQ